MPNWTREEEEEEPTFLGRVSPYHCDCCGMTDAHTPTCFAARQLTDDEVTYLMSFYPLPTTFREMEMLLEARKTGAKVVPPRPGWTKA